MRNIVALFAALLVGCTSVPVDTKKPYVPASNVVYYVGGDERGVVEFYAEQCPYIDNDRLHYGLTKSDTGFEEFCWARLWDGRVGLLIPSPDGVQQSTVNEIDLKRGPAPKPQALPNPNKKEV